MEKLTYAAAGVDKEEGYKEVQLIKKFIKKTYTPGVLSDLGGFSGLFELNKDAYEQPVLVSGTDGVGTKVKLAQMMDVHDTVGIDCVAMCANDILCQGAKPLFFLDYIATGKLVAERMAKIVEGIAEGCLQSNAALIGGETAEMPGIYQGEDYDIAGFCVGVVDKKKIIDGSKIKEGDVVLALPSSGVHSNGFSLVRKIIFDLKNLQLDDYIEELDAKIGEVLLTPTKIYVKPVLNILEKYEIHGLSHITGGGIYENLPRMLPENLDITIHENAFPKLKIFDVIQKWGDISKKEMYSTFNMGIGMVLVVAKEEAEEIMNLTKEAGQEIYKVGEIISGNKNVVFIEE